MSTARIAALLVALFFVGALAVFQLNGTDETVQVASGATDSVEPDSSPGAIASETTTTRSSQAPENFGPMPVLQEDALDGWLQTDGTSFDTVRGEVTIVQFWTYTCYNCTATIPFLQDIYATHKDSGLEIIGVHAPEFEREKDPAGIQEAADRLGVSWPIALDTEKKNFRSWQGSRRFWPRTYVIDQNGDVRFDKIGEGKYEKLEATVAYLLRNGA